MLPIDLESEATGVESNAARRVGYSKLWCDCLDHVCFPGSHKEKNAWPLQHLLGRSKPENQPQVAAFSDSRRVLVSLQRSSSASKLSVTPRSPTLKARHTTIARTI